MLRSDDLPLPCAPSASGHSSSDPSVGEPPAADFPVIATPFLRAVDLFAGSGGFSLGAGWAGVNVVASVESGRSACATYRRNLVASGFSTTILFEEDITVLRPQELMERSGLASGDCAILLGGPPCQGFSKHRFKNEGVSDPRNRLLLRYFDYVAALQPECFLLENVPGMLWPRHAAYLEEFYRLAAQYGYAIYEPAILNARDYGVPQNRKRVFILGFRVSCSRTYRWPANAGGGHNPSLPPSSHDVFRPAPRGDPNDIHMNHCERLIAAFERTPPNGGSRSESGRILDCHRNHDGHHDVYGRIDPRVPGPTMTTACINPSKGRFVHPTEPHGITVRQAARFQSFPDWFIFEGGLMSAGEQIGNAVPPEMARRLIQAITRDQLPVDAINRSAQCPA